MQNDCLNILKIIENKISNLPDSTLTAGQITTFLNPYSYLQLRKHPDLLNSFDNIMIDGGLLSSCLNKIDIPSKRISFDMTSLAPIIFNWVSQNNKSIYMVGAKQAEIECAIAVYKEEYPQMNIAGYRNGYFSNDTDLSGEITHILTVKPDVLVVGMGAVKQEQFLVELKNTGRWEGAAFTCGGFFHQTAKRGVTYYPPVFDRLNLRWLYRMIDEPALIRRYFYYYPLFVGIFLKDFLKW